MAGIITNLGGGNIIDTQGGTRALTGQLQGAQQGAQQNLQERQRQMQAYLEMLPELGAQMGFAPNQMNQFLGSQEGAIKNALGILGVGDIEGTFQGMSQALTTGQVQAQAGTEFTQAALGERQAEAAKRGLTPGTTEYVNFIYYGEAGTPETIERVQVGTEDVTVQGTGENGAEIPRQTAVQVSLDEVAKKRDINNLDDIVDVASYMIDNSGNGVTREQAAQAARVKAQIENARATGRQISIADQVGTLFDNYTASRTLDPANINQGTNTPEYLKGLDETALSTSGADMAMIKGPDGVPRFASRKLQPLQNQGDPDYRLQMNKTRENIREANQEAYNENLTNYRTALIRLAHTPEDRREVVARELEADPKMEAAFATFGDLGLKEISEMTYGLEGQGAPQVKETTQLGEGFVTRQQRTVPVGGAGQQTQETIQRPVYDYRTVPAQQSSPGLFALQQGFRDASPDAQTRENVAPGYLDSEQKAANIRYQDQMIQQMKGANEVGMAQAMSELQKAYIEGDSEARTEALKSFYALQTKAIESALENATGKAEREAILADALGRTDQTLETFGLDGNTQFTADDRNFFRKRWDNILNRVPTDSSGRIIGISSGGVISNLLGIPNRSSGESTGVKTAADLEAERAARAR